MQLVFIGVCISLCRHLIATSRWHPDYTLLLETAAPWPTCLILANTSADLCVVAGVLTSEEEDEVFCFGLQKLRGVQHTPCLWHFSADAMLYLASVMRQHCDGGLPQGPCYGAVVSKHLLNQSRAQSLKLAGEENALSFWQL